MGAEDTPRVARCVFKEEKIAVKVVRGGDSRKQEHGYQQRSPEHRTPGMPGDEGPSVTEQKSRQPARNDDPKQI